MSRCLIIPWLLTACLPQWPGAAAECPLGSGMAEDGECYPIDTADDGPEDTAQTDTGSTDTGPHTWYQDTDGDGFGNPATAFPSKTAPSGYVDNAEDCDDTNAAINPSTPELYGDGLDNNCDGETDEPSSIVGSYAGDIEITREYTAGSGATVTDTCTGSATATVYSNESSVFLYGTYSCSGPMSINGYFYASGSSTTSPSGQIHSEGVENCTSAWGQFFSTTSQPINGSFNPGDFIRLTIPENTSCMTNTRGTFSGQLALYKNQR